MKNITIVVIDTLNYKSTEWAVAQTRKIFPLSPLLVASDKEFMPCDTFVELSDKINKHSHSRVCLDIGEHVATDYALFIQHDGFPVRPELWRDEFLEYDYIGAPWIGQSEERSVGNGGFSLRSKRLLGLTPQLPQDTNKSHEYWLEDGIIGMIFRPWLERNGCRFPHSSLAHQFSHEHPFGPYLDSFGFHDRANAEHFLTPELYQEWLATY
jgi:hypothetical protein